RRRLLAALIAALVWAPAAACGGSADAPGEATEGVRPGEAYVAAPAGDSPAAMYVSVANPTAVADTLVGVRTADAERAEVHEQVHRGGLMQMAPVDALVVPASGELRMAPGGYHVMLIGPRRLEPG